MKIYNREIESWLEKKYHAWKSGKKSKTIDVYYDYDGTYEVKVEFIPQTSLDGKSECPLVILENKLNELIEAVNSLKGE